MVVRRQLLSPRALLVEESRASVAVTVAWMLTMFATAIALAVALLVFVAARWWQLTADPRNPVNFLPGMMMVSAAATGLLCLVLTVAVYRVRRDRPPVAITVVAVFVSCLPLATMLLLSFRG